MIKISQWDRFRMCAKSKLANLRYRWSKHDRWRMQERVLYFSKRDARNPTKLGHNAAPPTRQCATARHIRCTSDTLPPLWHANAPQPAAAATPWTRHIMPQLLHNQWRMTRCQCADAPQTAAAAAPVLALVAFLHVCLWLGATTSPINICNGYGRFVEVPDASHFGSCNHCDADSDGTLIECAGCNTRWCSNVCHINNNKNYCETFKYSMGSNGKPRVWCARCFGEYSEVPGEVLLKNSSFNVSRILNLSRCAIAYHILGLNGAVNQLIITNCLDIGLKNG